MGQGEYYSVRDIANLCGEQRSIVAEVMKYLAMEGFIKPVGSNETLYIRSKVILSPTQTANVLRVAAMQ